MAHNPPVCARFAITHGPGERLLRRCSIERFRIHPGFAVLVLSPVVAGLGLTLVEANHVIHYGRWWNPALEAQATDRAASVAVPTRKAALLCDSINGSIISVN